MTIPIRFGKPNDLRDVRAIAEAWPQLFVERGVAALCEDFNEGPAFVASDEGELTGFSIWRDALLERELLWLAVRPADLRRGVGSALVGAGLRGLAPGTRCFVKVATPDSRIPGTLFDPAGFEPARALYQKLGFAPGAVLRDHFGPENHVQIWQRVAQ